MPIRTVDSISCNHFAISLKNREEGEIYFFIFYFWGVRRGGYHTEIVKEREKKQTNCEFVKNEQ